MNEKLIKVFYGSDLLPYKDNTRTTHFPIVGNAFLGASETTEIRFYFDYIGDSSTTWVSVAKLPNGKQGSKVLSVDSDEDGNYATLSLSNWYTQAKGDVYIALQGYQGGVEYELNEDDIYEIHGTPTIQTTGSIKLAINYAPIGQVADYNDEFTTYQEILSALGDKANIEDVIFVGANIENLNPDIYTNGQLIFNVADKTIYQVVYQQFEVFYEWYDKSEIDNIIGVINDKLRVVELNNASGTLDETELIKLLAYPYIAFKYNNYLYHLDYEDNNTLIYRKALQQTDTGTTIIFVDSYISITKSSGAYLCDLDAKNVYSQAQTNDLLDQKQNRLVSGTNIKTINGETLLGSGNIDIQGGGLVVVDDELSPTSTNPVENRVITNELGNVRAELLGKSNSLSFSYLQALPTSSNITNFTKFDGTHFTDMTDFNTYVSGLSFSNSLFNDDEDFVSIANDSYLIDITLRVVKVSDIISNFKQGQFNIYITEFGVPDRWFAYISGNVRIVFYSLETEKVNLSIYATKTELRTAIGGVENNIAPAYNNTNIYSVGDKVIYNGQLYKCTTNIDTPEAFDSTKWAAISVSSGYVDLDSAQTITGVKTFTNPVNAPNTFNEINASDITNNTLTQEQYDLITNGKPTLISGTILSGSNIIIMPLKLWTANNYYYGLCIYSDGFGRHFIKNFIVNDNKGVSITSQGMRIGYNGKIVIDSLEQLNGKSIPAYPSSTGTFTLKCVDGTLTWVAD